MARSAPPLVGFVVIVAVGFVHGMWTERWNPSQELDDAIAHLNDLPERVGAWQAQPIEIDAKALQQAGAAGHWLRRFTHARTGASVTIILLCGRTGQMAVHRPEHCYRGSGYEMSAPAANQTLDLGEQGSAQFWTARFVKDDPGNPAQLRIFWSWLAGGAWQAPESPRLTFAGQTVLFKLYAVREDTGPKQPVENDSCLELLLALLPEITRSITSSSRPDPIP
jgi:hypothetical protein